MTWKWNLDNNDWRGYGLQPLYSCTARSRIGLANGERVKSRQLQTGPQTMSFAPRPRMLEDWEGRGASHQKPQQARTTVFPQHCVDSPLIIAHDINNERYFSHVSLKKYHELNYLHSDTDWWWVIIDNVHNAEYHRRFRCIMCGQHQWRQHWNSMRSKLQWKSCSLVPLLSNSAINMYPHESRFSFSSVMLDAPEHHRLAERYV